ncbi:hypothetical protein [Haloplanus salinarum]|uniref:hypothetical protein n=1 Tax=Haloplanus salinarum TaxID=1912324 RepID=UPI00214B1E0A|nr:hypothetical protein [Haloplanus salinarum]
MSLLLGLLEALGVGGSVMGAAGLVVLALYLYKGAGLATTVATLTASTLTYVVVSLVVLAVAIGAGWLDPHPGPFLAFVQDLFETIVKMGADAVASGF